jgi:hypothetical protein
MNNSLCNDEEKQQITEMQHPCPHQTNVIFHLPSVNMSCQTLSAAKNGLTQFPELLFPISPNLTNQNNASLSVTSPED